MKESLPSKIHKIKCKKCGNYNFWENDPPSYCNNCNTVFNINEKQDSPIIETLTNSKNSASINNSPVEPIASKQQFCHNCGKKFTRAESFCIQCGSKRIPQQIIPISVPKVRDINDNTPVSQPQQTIPASVPKVKDINDNTPVPQPQQTIPGFVTKAKDNSIHRRIVVSPYSKSEITTTEKVDIVTMYDNNAFRILGIESNADRKTVRGVQQSSKARAKLGGQISVSDPLGFLNAISRDENSIRTALNQIDNPNSRIQERIFWFFSVNQNDETALKKLKAGLFSDAERIWSESEELSASINLTILYHAYFVMKDIIVGDTDNWKRVFELWQNLVNNEKFWIFLETIEQKSEFEPSATHETFSALRQDVYKILLKPNIDCMKKARETNNDEIVQRHFELIRISNFSPRIITEIENEILYPLEEEINKELEELNNSVNINNNSSRLKAEKKTELDRIFNLFSIQTSKKITRFLNLSAKNPDFSRNIREKTASILREISISYFNDTESFDLSEVVLKKAKVFAQGTSILTKINEDLSIITERVKDAREFEKFAEYSEKIGNSVLTISKTQISYKNQTYHIQDVTGIRYGIYQESVNGIPTSRSYAIWLKFRNNSYPEKQYAKNEKNSSWYIPPVKSDTANNKKNSVENVIMIECADSTWFGLDQIQNRFNEIMKRLYHLVQLPLTNKMIQDFESGKRVNISDIIIDFTGMYKVFNYDPISKGLISLSSKYLGTKDVEMKEGKHKHLSWENYRGYQASEGKIWLFDDNGSWTSFSARDDWNANNLPIFLDYMNKDSNLAQAIEKCISGVTAVKDDQSEVIKTLDNSLAIDPKNWFTWWQKGRALRNLGRYKEALLSFDQVLKITPDNPEVWNIKGLIFSDMNEENEALNCFNKALSIDPQLSHVWYNRGMTFERMTNYKEAVRAIDRSLAIKFDSDIKNTRDRIHGMIGVN